VRQHCWLKLKDFALLPTGYLEDRRPASNMDPYTVTALLAETTILWEPTLEAEALAAKKLAMNV
jgi:glutamine synthetase